jgi:hypothetical protein
VKLWLLVEGKTDEAAVTALVEGIARAHGWTGPVEQVVLTERCHALRLRAGALLRDAGAKTCVVVTDAWCNAAAFRARGATAKSRRDRIVGTTCTSSTHKEVQTQLSVVGLKGPHAIGVACAELESWFLSSSDALQAVGCAHLKLRVDPQASCDAESVNLEATGSPVLERELTVYSAREARKMAEAMVATPTSIQLACQANASFADFVTQVKALFTPAAAPKKSSKLPSSRRKQARPARPVKRGS